MTNERRPPPTNRTYEAFIAAGTQAEDRQEPVDGVKGVWPYHRTGYGKRIYKLKDWMHTVCNIIRDFVRILRPNYSTGSWAHSNPTTKQSVVDAVQLEGSFQCIQDNPKKPPWVLSKEECLAADDKLNYIRGVMQSAIPKKCMRKFGGEKSHDAIEWGTVYAAWCLQEYRERHDSIPVYLQLIDLMTCLRSSTIRRDVLPNIIQDVKVKLAELECLLPPSEARWTKHELVHVAESIGEVGPTVYTNIYKHERVNNYMKRLNNNPASPIPSITKNYLVSYYV